MIPYLPTTKTHQTDQCSLQTQTTPGDLAHLVTQAVRTPTLHTHSESCLTGIVTTPTSNAIPITRNAAEPHQTLWLMLLRVETSCKPLWTSKCCLELCHRPTPSRRLQQVDVPEFQPLNTFYFDSVSSPTDQQTDVLNIPLGTSCSNLADTGVKTGTSLLTINNQENQGVDMQTYGVTRSDIPELVFSVNLML